MPSDTCLRTCIPDYDGFSAACQTEITAKAVQCVVTTGVQPVSVCEVRPLAEPGQVGLFACLALLAVMGKRRGKA